MFHQWLVELELLAINVKVDKKFKKGAKPNDIAILVSLIDKSTFIGLRDVNSYFNDVQDRDSH